MRAVTFFAVAAVLIVALAEGQYYVPRAYYTIDAEGHASPPIPLQRLRRSLYPYPASSANANADAHANANANGWGGGDANANANAHAEANAGGWGSGRGGSGRGGWGAPAPGGYGATNPNLSAGQSRHMAGAIYGGHSVTASSSVGLDSTGRGYYDQYTSVDN